MKYQFVSGKAICTLVVCCLLTYSLKAQTKQQYTSLTQVLQSGGALYGNPGPQSVNWTNEGNKYSYTSNDEIRSMDPKTLQDELIFTAKGITFPGSDKPFEYESFQWSHDSKHLVFKTNTRHIFRRSAISDYFDYDVTSKQLKQAAKDARTAELSPDGTRVGMERGGNMFVYNFASGKE